MPELPEVETIRQDLRKKILHKKITKLVILKSKFSSEVIKSLQKKCAGTAVGEIERYGKLLVFKLENIDQYLLIHLKMTGQLLYQYGEHLMVGGHSFSTLNTHLPDKFTQAIFCFSDRSKLFFNDMRRFGYIKLVSKEELQRIVEKFGIEPLKKNFTFKNFSHLFQKKKMNVKALLLNQSLVAGIGNIYADEICFAAGVLPSRKTTSLVGREVKKLYSCSNSILTKAIKYRGTTFNNYIDSEGNKGNFSAFLKVYARKGKSCLRCRNKDSVIEKSRVAGRGTHFCRVCQK